VTSDENVMPAERALVLGGGGVAGIAWMTGLLIGLADVGQDVTGADLIIGTSAGSNPDTLSRDRSEC
jgi:NTE family protein